MHSPGRGNPFRTQVDNSIQHSRPVSTETEIERCERITREMKEHFNNHTRNSLKANGIDHIPSNIFIN